MQILSDDVFNIWRYFAADRPFWWVHETKVYSALNRPTLYQTERTCETSPGSPSGHMMIGAGFLFISLITVEKLIVRNFRSNGIRRILRYLARIAFAAFLIVLALSRMYFSTHFLHQCILGAVFGICITEAVVFTKLTDKIQLMQKSSWFKCALLMSAGVGASYWIVKAIYGNPMESVHLVKTNESFEFCMINFRWVVILGLQILLWSSLSKTRENRRILSNSQHFYDLWIHDGSPIRKKTRQEEHPATSQIETSYEHSIYNYFDDNSMAIRTLHAENDENFRLLHLYRSRLWSISIFVT